LHGAETWRLQGVDQKHMESFEMWYWRMMEKISWTDYVRNEEMLLIVKEQISCKVGAHCTGEVRSLF
jgi:hypothetical protein